MSFYETHILPRLLAWAMDDPRLAEERAQAIPHARGRVLELGIGSGLNLPYYRPDRVETVFGLDPSPALRRMAEGRAAAAPFPVTLLPARAEGIPLDAASVDTVVSTWTLCSIADLPRALSEVRRVLRPGGRLVFVEHGRAPEDGVVAWQRRLNPVWRRIGGGCTLDRDMGALLTAHGFCVEGLRTGYLERTPRVLGYLYRGTAHSDGSPHASPPAEPGP